MSRKMPNFPIYTPANIPQLRRGLAGSPEGLPVTACFTGSTVMTTAGYLEHQAHCDMLACLSKMAPKTFTLLTEFSPLL